MEPQTRRHDLDWLRIIVFVMLILYHIGMFYVPWDWHVKSAYAPVEALEPVMRLSNSWRLAVLFVISGLALRFAIDKTGARALIPRRLARLGLPLLFGMLVICAPQAWFELQQDGAWDGSVGGFYLRYLAPPWVAIEGWDIITPTWNHLWFVLYVLIYTLVVLGAVAAFGTGYLDHAVGWAATRPAAMLGLPVAVSLVLLWVLFDSYGAQQTFFGDWQRAAQHGLEFLIGFSIAKTTAIWAFLWRIRWGALATAVLLSVPRVWPEILSDGGGAAHAVARLLHGWACVFAVFGWAQAIPRGSDRWRSYLSDAVFPWYVLHQTLIIVVGASITGWGLGVGAESLTVIGATFAGCFLIHHFVVRRMGRFAVLLGGRP